MPQAQPWMKPMDHAAKIEALRQRACATDARIAGVRDRRKEFALGAVEGNAASVKAINEIDQEAAALRRERDTLSAAIEQVEQQRIREHNERQAEERRHREAEARTAVDALLAVNGQVDAAMRALSALLAKRTAVIRELGDTGLVSAPLILRMLQRAGPTAAAHAAGLRSFVGLEHVPRQQVVSLTESSKTLRSAVAASDAQQTQAA